MGVPPNVVLAATFNDFPDPDSVDLSTFLLYTGFYYHTGRYAVDLVDRRASFTPTSQLSLGLGYTVALKPGIRSLRGCDLEAASPLPLSGGGSTSSIATFRFDVVGAGASHLPVPVPPSPPTYRQVTAVFAAHCAAGGCHLGDGDGGPDSNGSCIDNAAGGLSLCARDARVALVGIPSRQINRLVLVAPHDSSRSYLLRKVIGAPPLVGHVGVPNDDNLSRDDQRTIQDWIDNGALGSLPAQTDDGGV